MIGVDYDLFWRLNPKTLSPFIKAFDLSKKYQDEMCWTMGRYIQLAVGSTLSKECKYPNHPFLSGVADGTMTSKEIKTRFMNDMIRLNSRFKKDGD